MSSLRRLTALLSGLLLLQLALLGGRSSCVSHTGAMTHAPAGAMQAATGSHDASLAAAATDACGAQRATDTCTSMPSCAKAIGIPSSIVTHVALVPAASARPEPAALRSHTAAGPDAPPPRG